ncbi:MAG: integrin alpha [Phycisphaerales bacterium]
MRVQMCVCAVVAMPALGDIGPAAGFVEPGTRVLGVYDAQTPGEQFGAILRRLGDLNGDGVSEWTANGPFCDIPFENAGRVIIVDGATGVVAREHFGVEAQNELSGPMRCDDLTGDGIPEYALFSGPSATVGRAWIYNGDLSVPIEDAVIHTQTGVATDYHYFGENLGDINGDGIGDLAWTAELGSTKSGQTGWVRILSGADPTVVLREHAGDAPGDRFGNMTGLMGDVNGNGVEDYWISAPQSDPPSTRGYARVYSGADGSQLCEALPNQNTGAVLGFFYGFAMDDITGDGVKELFIPDTGDYRFGLETGRVFVYDVVNCARVWQRSGSGAGQGFGIAHEYDADLTGDGVEELVVGSYLASEGAANAGRVQVLNGADGSILRTVTSTNAGEWFGADTTGVGDLDGDGVADFGVAAPNATVAGPGSGRLYVIAGIPAGACSGIDLVPDGVLNTGDIDAFVAAFLARESPADYTSDGVHNIDDLDLFVEGFNAGCD